MLSDVPEPEFALCIRSLRPLGRQDLFQNVRGDLRRYTALSSRKRYLLFEQGLWAVVIYRFGRWTRGIRLPVIGFAFRSFAFALFKVCEVLTGISIPAGAQIGKGFYVGHFGGIVLNNRVIVGENCSIGPGVVIGTRGMGDTGAPVIGNNVYIGVGAKVLGGITIGDNVKIGANAVVLTDIPEGATAVGIPAAMGRQ
jgi:serine O-acetyltransferase